MRAAAATARTSFTTVSTILRASSLARDFVRTSRGPARKWRYRCANSKSVWSTARRRCCRKCGSQLQRARKARRIFPCARCEDRRQDRAAHVLDMRRFGNQRGDVHDGAERIDSGGANFFPPLSTPFCKLTSVAEEESSGARVRAADSVSVVFTQKRTASAPRTASSSVEASTRTVSLNCRVSSSRPSFLAASTKRSAPDHHNGERRRAPAFRRNNRQRHPRHDGDARPIFR